MPIVKRRLNYMGTDGVQQTLHFETSSELVLRPDGTNMEDSVTKIYSDLDQMKTELIQKITADIADIVNGSPEAFNTLKEFYDWIQEHETDALSMLSSINDLKDRVTALETSGATYRLVAL
ncbi:MAG: hypothetical protein NC489_08410 [Ruminococcus flavefaciens]|nr:hypothetical protein [Ruminococcus flavefaciens]